MPLSSGIRRGSWLGLVVALTAGCGDSGSKPEPDRLPVGAVAQVASDPVPRAQFAHFLRAECLKLTRLHRRPAGAPPAADEPMPCAGQYADARDRTLQLLITTRWYRIEARRRDVEPPVARSRHALQALERRRFVGDAFSAPQFRRRTGLTRQDLRLLVDWALLRERLAGRAADTLDIALGPRYRPLTTCKRGFRVPECTIDL